MVIRKDILILPFESMEISTCKIVLLLELWGSFGQVIFPMSPHSPMPY